MKAAEVTQRHQEFLAACSSVDASFRALMELVPEVEAGGKKRRQFTLETLHSANEVARYLKNVRLHGLVVAQEIMNQTDESREAALEAQKGRFKVVGGGDAEGEKA